MSFCIPPLASGLTVFAAAAEPVWGLGKVGLGGVVLIAILRIVVVAWLISNTGRRD
jgi:hypothetical protein